jgi:hypothetical protein
MLTAAEPSQPPVPWILPRPHATGTLSGGCASRQDMAAIDDSTHSMDTLGFGSMSAVRDWHVDIFLGTFNMCHSLNLEGRMEQEPLTLPLSDLLLTKLQIVKLNPKDALDSLVLLGDHEVSGTDSRPAAEGISIVNASLAFVAEIGAGTRRSATI